MHTTQKLAFLAIYLFTLPALAHEGGGDGEHLNVGFYYGHDGSFEAPANPPEPATLLVDTHPWELDTVFYSLTPTDQVPFNGWSGEFPGFRTLLEADEEESGHGYYSWLNASRGVATPDLRLHLVSKDPDLTILDPGTTTELTYPHVIGTNTANHHLIYYVDQSTGVQEGEVLNATFYLTDANGGLAQSENFTLQFLIGQDSLLQGDLDGDGFVGLDDLDIILNNWNLNVPPADAAADPTGDGFVGLDDLDIVLNNWNAGSPPSSSNIPEPASAALTGLGLAALLRRRR